MTSNTVAISAEEMGASARNVLARMSTRRESLEGGASAAATKVWAVAADLGWLMLPVPIERDGLGQDFSVLSALYFELGRVLSPMPLVGAMIAAHALSYSHSDQSTRLLQSIMAGRAMIAAHLPGKTRLPASRLNGILVLNGSIEAVLFPRNSSHLLVLAELDGEDAVLVLELGDRAIHVKPRDTWDRTREIADVEFARLRLNSTSLIACGRLAETVIRSTRAHFDLATSCDSIGGAEQILAETVEYSKRRRQFGREIASFQAIKHRCADMKSWLEAARSLTREAVKRYSAGDIDTPLSAGAKLYASDVYRQIAVDSIQIHGGIGFTWDHDCHLFLKRALLNEQLGGSPEEYGDWLFDEFAARTRRAGMS